MSGATDVCYLTAAELGELYRRRALSPVEVVDAILERIDRVDNRVNAFVTVTAEAARAEAREAERRLRDGDEAGPLDGVPVTLKDLIPTRGIRTTVGSPLREDWLPEFDAPVVSRIRDAGGVLVGKTNTPEFGWKAETTSLVAGSTRNPWNLELTPGGSSGGASAALAAGCGPLAVGSDGAGSVRIPASFTGVVGLKPSYALVPHYPVSMIGNLSHVGPMARSVHDVALLLDVIGGADRRDPHSWSHGGPLAASVSGHHREYRAAWVPALPYCAVDDDVARVTASAVDVLADAGCVVDELDWPLGDPYEIVEAYWLAGTAAQQPPDLDGIRERIDPGRLPLIERGLSLRARDLAGMSRHVSDYSEAVYRLLDAYDVVMTPAVPCRPFPVGRSGPETVGGQVRPLPIGWPVFSYPFNLTGQPAISVPCGFDDLGTPVGLQIAGRWRDDLTVLQVAALLERASPWRERYTDIDL